MEKVVATIETPNNHQGIFLPERKNSDEFSPDFLDNINPINKVIDKNEVALDKTHMTFIINNNANPNDVEFISSNKWLNDKIIEHGLNSRDFVSAEATLIYTSN